MGAAEPAMDRTIRAEKDQARTQLREALSGALDAGLEDWQIRDEVEDYLGETA